MFLIRREIILGKIIKELKEKQSFDARFGLYYDALFEKVKAKYEKLKEEEFDQILVLGKRKYLILDNRYDKLKGEDFSIWLTENGKAYSFLKNFTRFFYGIISLINVIIDLIKKI